LVKPTFVFHCVVSAQLSYERVSACQPSQACSQNPCVPFLSAGLRGTFPCNNHPLIFSFMPVLRCQSLELCLYICISAVHYSSSKNILYESGWQL